MHWNNLPAEQQHVLVHTIKWIQEGALGTERACRVENLVSFPLKKKAENK